MQRPLFDPARMAGARAPEGPAPAPVASPGGGPAMRVSELAGLIDRALRNGLPARVRVVGEVSGFRERTHWYFDLKDESAVVNCVMFASAARRAGFTPANGQAVVVTGGVEFYAPQGRASLKVDAIEPVGAGALDLAFRALAAELRALGWFDAERKRPVPVFPRAVGVVTSRTGAALQDVLDTMRRRCPAVGVVLLDVRVQGDRAAPEIAAAVDWLGREHERLGIDAILLTRGGGSMEDLWAFNDRRVAEAIVRCPVPVVAAIGHETDTTIAELVADERAATPTQAAMRLTPDRAALLEQVASMARRLGMLVRTRWEAGAASQRSAEQSLTRVIRGMLAEHGGRIVRVAGGLERVRPQAALQRRRDAASDAAARLAGAIARRLDRGELERAAERLRLVIAARCGREDARAQAAERQLRAVGPLSVLARGFTCTLREDGTLVRSVAQVGAGDRVRTVVPDGSFDSVVEPGTRGDALGAAGSSGRRGSRAGRGPGAGRAPAGRHDQMDLFSRGG